MALDLTGIVDKLIGFLPQEWQDKAKGARKAIVTVVGALLTVLTLVTDRFGFIIPDNLKKPLTIAISVLTAALTYLVPNDPAPVAAIDSP